jgi:hypothetical protein
VHDEREVTHEPSFPVVRFVSTLGAAPIHRVGLPSASFVAWVRKERVAKRAIGKPTRDSESVDDEVHALEREAFARC